MAEVRFDLVDAPELSGVCLRQHRSDRRLPASLVPHAKYQARIAAKGYGLLCPRLGQRQRLFAKDMLASSCRSFNLGSVKGMRCSEHHRFDSRVIERIGVVGRHKNAPLGAERAYCLNVWLDDADNTNVRRGGPKHIEYLLAPPTHSDESDSDGPRHLCLFTRHHRSAPSFPVAVRICDSVSC